MSLNQLKDSIRDRKTISFTYNKPGKKQGQRIGNPHAIFILRKKDGTESTKVHIVQVDGVTDSGQEFPSWRMFNIEELGDIEVLSRDFEISDQYKPESEMYKFVICKV